jgi:hypothetical protein
MDTTLQNIWITHGGYKRSLAEGIRQTVRRGQTNPVSFMVSWRAFLEVGRLRLPGQTGIEMASIARSSNVAELRAKQYLRKDNTRCAFVLMIAARALPRSVGLSL